MGRRIAFPLAIVPGLLVGLFSLACSRSAEDPSPEPPAAGDAEAQEATVQEAAVRVAAAETDAESVAFASPRSAPVDPIRDYDAQCPAEPDPSLECEWLRSLVVADVVDRLEKIEHAGDRRGIDTAMLALDTLDEPEILIAACRILGKFPDTPGLAEKVVPLLDSPYYSVQKIAADVVAALPDQALNSMAHKWKENHAGIRVPTPYDELDFPATYDGMGFPEYPGMERYTPGDSDRSVGWWSPDPPSDVANRLAQAMGVQSMGFEQWQARSQQE